MALGSGAPGFSIGATTFSGASTGLDPNILFNDWIMTRGSYTTAEQSVVLTILQTVAFDQAAPSDAATTATGNTAPGSATGTSGGQTGGASTPATALGSAGGTTAPAPSAATVAPDVPADDPGSPSTVALFSTPSQGSGGVAPLDDPSGGGIPVPEPPGVAILLAGLVSVGLVRARNSRRR